MSSQQRHIPLLLESVKILVWGMLAAGTGSNATVERVFSKVTWTLQGRRSSVKPKLLKNILAINELGPTTDAVTVPLMEKVFEWAVPI